MEQRQATPLRGRGLNSVDEHIEELSLAQLEYIHGGFIWILVRFYMQQVYIRSKKEMDGAVGLARSLRPQRSVGAPGRSPVGPPRGALVSQPDGRRTRPAGHLGR
jgi:hypothetical protein